MQMLPNNKIAVRIAQYYFNATRKRATTATMKMSIGQAKSLIGAGFTPEEIIIVINELVERPPKNGFKSLGLLSYVMEDVLTKFKAKEVKKAFETVKANPTPEIFLAESKKVANIVQTIGNRVGKEFNTNLF